MASDQVLLKDGRLLKGHIMGQTNRSLLLRPETPGAKPFFIPAADIETVVHESRPEEQPSPESGRFAQVESLLGVSLFSSKTLPFHAAPVLMLNGGFRLHPALEVGGGLDLWPALSGAVSVTDGQTLRQYNAYSAYGGGFYGKVFPFYRDRYARVEPYLMGGFHWMHTTPKASGDYFSGKAYVAGLGASWAWWKPVYIETRFLFQHADFDTVKFQSGTGSIAGVQQNAYTLAAGLAYRFL